MVPDSGSTRSYALAPDAVGGRAATPTEEDLRRLLEQHAGNVAAVGRSLGKARMQIHRWIQRYGIELEEYRG